jgi:hypothetical protein
MLPPRSQALTLLLAPFACAVTYVASTYNGSDNLAKAVRNAKGVLADFQEFKEALEKAKGIKARWNLQVDFLTFRRQAPCNPSTRSNTN